ncbi:MAG: FecR domain-containing protein [Bacteroidota bacterium]
MMNTRNRLWMLMGKKLSGEITIVEEKELDTLFQSYPDVWYAYEVLSADHNEKVPEEFIGELRSLLAVNNTTLPDANDDAPIVETSRLTRLWPWLAAAASLLVIISAGWMLNSKYLTGAKGPAENTNNVIAVQNGTRTTVTLPDGSLVMLNAGSKLSYSKNYASAKVREVYLSGEAYFKVVHDAQHEFIIHTYHFDVKDIGTMFNVKAYPGEKTAEAVLIEGAIEILFRNHQRSSILLQPKQKIIFNTDSAIADKSATHSISPAGYKVMPLDSDRRSINHFAETAWIDNQMIFKNEAFGEVTKRMERKYNVNISFTDDRLKNTTLTGIFRNENVEEALKELQQISSFKFHIQRDSITLSGL